MYIVGVVWSCKDQGWVAQKINLWYHSFLFLVAMTLAITRSNYSSEWKSSTDLASNWKVWSKISFNAVPGQSTVDSSHLVELHHSQHCSIVHNLESIKGFLMKHCEFKRRIFFMARSSAYIFFLLLRLKNSVIWSSVKYTAAKGFNPMRVLS